MRLASVLLACCAMAACTSEPIAAPVTASSLPAALPVQTAQATNVQAGCPTKAAATIPVQLPQPGFLPPPTPGAKVAVPQRLHGSEPDYPAASKSCREEGKVAITYCVTIEGRLENVQVVTSSGFARLDNSILAWAARDRHTPGMIDGRPRRYCGLLFEHEFEIADKPQEHAGGASSNPVSGG